MNIIQDACLRAGTIQVKYHTVKWGRLADAGWVTRFVEDGIAFMSYEKPGMPPRVGRTSYDNKMLSEVETEV